MFRLTSYIIRFKYQIVHIVCTYNCSAHEFQSNPLKYFHRYFAISGGFLCFHVGAHITK